MNLSDQGFLDVAGQRLEYRMVGPRPGDAPTLVMLHEGLGSAAMWGDFPERLAAATGAGVFAYSRAGYGNSSLVKLPRPLTYQSDEAKQVLPKLLDAIGVQRFVLVGHSDGATISTIYAGSHQDHRLHGLVLMAPHFFNEELSVKSIAEAKQAYESGDLKQKLARWHADPDNAFWGWNTAWLDPGYRNWDISETLAYVRVPILIIQGELDQYGSAGQVTVAQQECYCPVEVLMLPGVRHTPFREATEQTLSAMTSFLRPLLRQETVTVEQLEKSHG